jgi:hypothetical protein
MAEVSVFREAVDLLAGDLLPNRTGAGVRFTVNGRAVAEPGEPLPGLTRLGDYRIVARDPEEGSACLAAQFWFDDEAAICALRLKAKGDHLAECEIIRGPPRFPGETGVDARTLTVPRACFAQEVPAERRLSRQALIATARGYYEAVNREDPSLARLDPCGGRVEQGTLITGNPDFRFEFYEGLDGQALPNFGLWTAAEQFQRGLWNADEVPQVRFASVEPRTGVVCAFMTYRPWAKRAWADVEGTGRVGPIGRGDRRVGLNAMEVFKIDHRSILAMESVWSMESADWLNPWSS